MKNAAILTVSGLALRLAGMLLRVRIAAALGSEGMGLYQLVFTLYGFFISAATAGISVAATRLSAEKIGSGRADAVRRTLWRLVLAGGVCGTLAGAVQLALAHPAAAFLLGEERCTLSLQVLAFSLPFMGVGAALRGYFLAARNVAPGVRSQLVEQAVRVALVLWVLQKTAGMGLGLYCAAVVAGNTVSEALSCTWMLLAAARENRRLRRMAALPRRGFAGEWPRPEPQPAARGAGEGARGGGAAALRRGNSARGAEAAAPVGRNTTLGRKTNARDRGSAAPHGGAAAPGKAGFLPQLAGIMLPVQGDRCISSALHAAETALVPPCLALYLGSRSAALAQFGELRGMALPLMTFPFSFLGALSGLLMPEIARARAQRDTPRLQRLVGRMLTVTAGISLFAGAFFAVWAVPLAELVYHDSTVAGYLLLLSPAVPFMYLESMVDGVMKGMGEQLAAFGYRLADSALRLAGVVLLLPRFGIIGFLAIMLLSNAFTCVLNLRRMLRVAGLRFRLWDWALCPALLLLPALGVCLGLQSVLAGQGALLRLVAAGGGMTACFGALFWRFSLRGLRAELRAGAQKSPAEVCRAGGLD